MIHVAFNIDDNFKEKVKVVIKSILANTKSEVCFHIVGANVVMEGVNIKCYPAPSLAELPQIKQVGEITTAAGYRLLLPEILDINKVIYLDCDIIVLQDIAELWKYKVKYIGAVIDPCYKVHAERLGLEMGYINSGVMLMNLKDLREFNFIEKCKNVSGYNITLPDQDVINIVIGKEMQHLPHKWNVYSKIFNPCIPQIGKARKEPAIIHWIGPEKPWKYDVVWKAEEYLKFA